MGEAKRRHTMLKKLIAIFIIPILALTSCGVPEISRDKPGIVCTVFPAYDFAREVLGGSDEFDLKLLLKPGSEVHSYEPTPRDIIDIQNCKIFIYTGGESDEWVKNILNSIDTSGMEIISMMDYVEVLEEETVEGMQTEEEEEDEPQYDEHVWTSPVNAARIIQAISDSIIGMADDSGDRYKANADSYIAELNKLDGEFRQIAENAKRDTIVFGDRFPFRYFAEEYGLRYYAAFPGCSSETEADAKTVAFLIDKVKDEGIPMVFYPEMSNQKVAITICESTGAEPMQFNSCHNVTDEEFKQGATYLSLMHENINALREALED